MMMMININSREEIFYTTLGRRKLNKCLIDMKNIHISSLSSQIHDVFTLAHFLYFFFHLPISLSFFSSI